MGRVLVSLVLVLAGCAAEDSNPEPTAPWAPSSALAYTSVRLEFVSRDTDTTPPGAIAPGAGASDGLKMMRDAPIGCMQAGMFYGFCLMMAPFFPALAANRVQDQEISLREIRAMAEHIHAWDLPERLRSQLERSARDAHLPQPAPDTEDPRTVTLKVTAGPLGMSHDGYKGGRISLTFPCRFELVDGDDQLIRVLESSRYDSFDATDWVGKEELNETLDRWARSLPREAVATLLVEWQPRIVLEPITPQLVVRRNFIGVVQDHWSFADSTTPLLEWQALDDALDPAIFSEVSDLRYELTIGSDDDPIYRAIDLSEPRHRVSRELASCGYYHWKPKARYRYRGMEFTTSLRTRQWSEDVTLDHFYVLMTPAERCREPRWQPTPAIPAPSS
jgi:hypothetical protein